MWFEKLLCCVLMSRVISCSSKRMESYGQVQMSRNTIEEPTTTNDELPCLAIGGNCLNINMCPEERRSMVNGLCPTQEWKGFECCDLRSVTGKLCAEEGGICISRYADCEEKITFFEGGDCSINEKCC